MSHQFDEFDSDDHAARWQLAPAAVTPPQPIANQPAPGRRVLPLVLFLATCYTTYSLGQREFQQGVVYSAALMWILLCHEMGHYVQARRYHVPASLPYFIPMPMGPLGTMGAVIGMRGNMGDRKALFDIGISGPLAGLLPALICCTLGLKWSVFVTPTPDPNETTIGAPLLFEFLESWLLGPRPAGMALNLHPLAYAGWVGILITALNLLPIGQLDGGHILYAILRKKAHFVASALLFAAIGAELLTGRYEWFLMLLLLVLMGPNHPPTANDDVPLGTGRILLGWLTLAFVIIGFTPTPFL